MNSDFSVDFVFFVKSMELSTLSENFLKKKIHVCQIFVEIYQNCVKYLWSNRSWKMHVGVDCLHYFVKFSPIPEISYLEISQKS